MAIIIPLGLILLCAGALGVYYLFEGAGGMMSLFMAVDRTDMMDAQMYEDPSGTVLPYRLYLPENPDPAAKYPLVLYLHGAGESGSDNRAQTKKNSVMQTLLSKENLAEYPCIVVAPQNPEGRWWADDGMPPVLLGLLEQLKASHPVDSARVYITELSMGGYGTWEMLAQYPDYFAAAVPICGGGDPETVQLFKDVPVWAFHGAKDSVVSPEGSRGMVRALEDVGAADTRYTEYPGEGHQSWEKAYREPELFPWLFAQAKEAN